MASFTVEDVSKYRDKVWKLKAIDKKDFIHSKIIKKGQNNNYKENIFLVSAEKVCVRAFKVLYGVSNNLIYTSNRFTTKERPTVKLNKIVKFLNEMADWSNYMPDSIEIHLPYTNKQIVYDMFIESLTVDNTQYKVSYKYFIFCWKKYCFNLKVRKVTRFSKCSYCTVQDEKITCTKDPDVRRKLKKQKMKHVMLNFEDREIYETHKNMSKLVKERYLSVAIDGADFGRYALPYFGVKDKKSDTGYKNPITTIVVIAHGHGTFIYTVPFNLPSNSNSIIHALQLTLTKLKKMYSSDDKRWPSTLFVQVKMYMFI